MLEPIRTYETTLHGQLVTVKVYPPAGDGEEVWSSPRAIMRRRAADVYKIDPLYNDH